MDEELKNCCESKYFKFDRFICENKDDFDLIICKNKAMNIGIRNAKLILNHNVVKEQKNVHNFLFSNHKTIKNIIESIFDDKLEEYDEFKCNIVDMSHNEIYSAIFRYKDMNYECIKING